MLISMPPVKLVDLRSCLPEGTYNVRVERADFVEKPKNPEANKYIHVWLKVTGPDPQYARRMIFVNYPIEGSGTYRLLELLSVTGHPEDFVLRSPEELVGLEFSAAVMVEKGTGDFPDKNVIRKHLGFPV